MFHIARASIHREGAHTADPPRGICGWRMVRDRLPSIGAVLALCFVLSVSAAVAVRLAGGATRRPSPATGLLPNGRQLAPAGTRVTLGNLPTGGALTADGRFLWTVSAGIGNNDVRIVDTCAAPRLPDLAGSRRVRWDCAGLGPPAGVRVGVVGLAMAADSVSLQASGPR